MRLFDKLPDSIQVNGKEYAVNMAFDNILHILEMLKDDRLSDGVKVLTGLNMLFEELPDLPFEELIVVWGEAFNALLGQEQEIEYDLKGNPMPKRSKEEKKKVFDFSQDSDYIFSSFMQDYGINLFKEQGELHWYEFNSLLNGLSENTKLRKVIEIRQAPFPKGSENAKKREELRKLKKIYELKGD